MSKKTAYDDIVNNINLLTYTNIELIDLNNNIEHDNLSKIKIEEFSSKIEGLGIKIKEIELKLHDLMISSFSESSTLKSENLEFKMLIPNYNSLSTILDRLSIENVKLFHFKYYLDFDSEEERSEKEILQNKIISALNNELIEFFERTNFSKVYAYLSEERTFK